MADLIAVMGTVAGSEPTITLVSLLGLDPDASLVQRRYQDIGDASALPAWTLGVTQSTSTDHEGTRNMSTVTTKDGVEIYYKDWGPRDGKVIHFHHGWPLSSDDWDAQMLFFVNKGFRVIAHDRRGHGRSSQVWDGHDMDHYADDVAAVVEKLGTQGAMHVGHSTGGGQVVRYIARHGQDKVSKAVLISAVPPLMVKTESNPGGTPKDVFDGFKPHSRLTAPSSITMFPQVPSMAIIAQAPSHRKR